MKCVSGRVRPATNKEKRNSSFVLRNERRFSDRLVYQLFATRLRSRQRRAAKRGGNGSTNERFSWRRSVFRDGTCNRFRTITVNWSHLLVPIVVNTVIPGVLRARLPMHSAQRPLTVSRIIRLVRRRSIFIIFYYFTNFLNSL